MRTAAIGAICACCAAAATPASPATTKAAGTAAPEAVQQAYRDALNAQDASAALSLFEIRTPGERAMAEVYVTNDLAAAKLAAAAEKAFGVDVIGGGTLLPPKPPQHDHERWVIEGDLATLRPIRRGLIDKRDRPRCPPLRRTPAGYRIDLVAWGLNWMDGPDAADIRGRHRRTGDFDRQRERVERGFYRWIDELRDAVSEQAFLDLEPNSPPPKLPRPFRRPVKVDLSSPAATFLTAAVATAEGDGETLLRCYEMLDPADAAQLKAYARHVTAVADLEEAALAKFGVAGRKVHVFVPLPHPRRDALSALDDTDLTRIVVTGGEAVLKEMDADEFGIEFVRIDDHWKLRSRPKAMVGQKDDDPNDWAMIYDWMATLEQRFTGEIKAGRHASIDDARRAIEAAAKQMQPERIS